VKRALRPACVASCGDRLVIRISDFGHRWLKKNPDDRNFDGLMFFRSAASGLHVPAALLRKLTTHEARKRRANVRPLVGCCEELDSGQRNTRTPLGVHYRK
jgi:hypothetical protein